MIWRMLMTFHARVSRIVLGRRLCTKSELLKAAADASRERISAKVDDLERTTSQIARDCGVMAEVQPPPVPNGH